ncbi:type II toxin-antitoxin system Phd/YefM family antitoxin [Candidatus Uhrbacteria bacterium]|nr:type II toxin-antitoxin system Phd/YefM family antitoxin [Candidatus Uhrbacteria bacterium]
MSATKARDAFAEVVNLTAYGKERVVLTRRGRRLAALVPVEDLDKLEALEDEEDVRVSLEALSEPGRISLDELEAELGL